MNISRHFRIVGTGKYLPRTIVTSEVLELQAGLAPGWGFERSGVRERHFVSTDESCAYMGARALEQALTAAGLVFEDLDLLVNAAGSYDFPIPYQACLIPREMGLTDAGVPCFDLDATCLSFVTALDVVSTLIAAGRFRRVAIVSAEIASKSLNPSQEETFTLLADGAAAVIVEQAGPADGITVLRSHMETYSQGAGYTMLPGGGNVWHPRDRSLPSDLFTFDMKGKEVLRLAMEKLPAFMATLFEGLPFTIQDLDLVIPHQPSRVGLAFFKRMSGLPDERICSNLEDHGNCISASIPMALHDAWSSGRILPGYKVMIAGTAAGLSLGGIVMQWPQA
ncbi:MAG: 3-oxoacyl-[acyl-carrier-protein] synthase III C-terminal domain-containing protein [Bacteroidia bacterium]|nr:3-oxoacyl-[acyl-carrier-protein] synthase III C-terminal domain-containing protein [Bacteroidia bacterium]